MATNNSNGERPVIIYHYKFSPYARRIQWYLALRGIPYTECLQPPILPRPDINALGLSYRRIPILSMGRDIYLDTRLQLSKLESSPHLASLAAPLSSSERSTPEHALITKLLERWCIDAGLFAAGASLIPQDLPVVKDPKFASDRADFFSSPPSSNRGNGEVQSPEAQAQAAALKRAESLEEIRSCFALLEHHLRDGRDWILATETPTLADIEAVWLPHWLVLGLPGALDHPSTSQPYVTPSQFPALFAWVRRFDALVKSKNAKPGRVKGDEARKMVVASEWNEDPVTSDSAIVDEGDALVKVLGLRRGDQIVVNPTDTGRNHKDVGPLVGINGDEVVWEARTKEGDAVRVHAPRHGFKVRKAAQVKL